MFRSAGCSLLRAEGFFCSLGVLYGGLGIGKLQILIKKYRPQPLDLDPDRYSAWKAGSGSNWYGSETLVPRAGNYVYCADLNLPWDCSLVCSLSAPATCLAWNGAGTGYLLLLRYSTCTRLFGGFAFIIWCLSVKTNEGCCPLTIYCNHTFPEPYF